jgi:hypothetical protein
MSWRLVSADPFTGIKTYWQWDHLEKRNVLRYEYPDLQVNVDYATALRNDTDLTKHGMKGDNVLFYGHIPAAVMHELMLAGVDTNDPKELVKWLNRNPLLKTTDAHHS